MTVSSIIQIEVSFTNCRKIASTGQVILRIEHSDQFQGIETDCSVFSGSAMTDFSDT